MRIEMLQRQVMFVVVLLLLLLLMLLLQVDKQNKVLAVS